MPQGLRAALIAVIACCPAAVGAPGEAAAQAGRDLEIDANGTCPRQEDLVRLNPALDDGLVASLRNRVATPVRAQVPIYRSRDLRGQLIANAVLGFDDDVEVVIGSAAALSGPVLVRRLRDPICGWIDAADLERFAVPLRLVDVPGFRSEKDRVGDSSRLDARVLVKNRIDRQTGYARPAPLFEAPFHGELEPSDERRRGSAAPFELLSVFEIRRPDGQPCGLYNETGCFLRVGTAGPTSRAEPARIRGWIKGHDVAFWPTALAIYYAPGKQGLKIHETEPSARIGTPFADPAARQRILAYQPEGRYEEPRERNIMRFPVIRGTAYQERPGSGPPSPSESLSYIYEILFSGQACLDDPSGSRVGCIPEPQVKDEIARLGQAVSAIGQVDVLFVVGASQSMRPYMRSVSRAIRTLVQRATSRSDLSFRYSIALYGDYNRYRQGGIDYLALPFNADLSGMLPIERVGSYEDENKDRFEAPFAALERAVGEANWRPDVPSRLVVWIGDHGNRPAGKHVTAAGELIETKTAQSVIDAIQAADIRLREGAGIATKTRFLAIQAQGEVTATGQKFREDAAAIARGLGETLFRMPGPRNKQTLDQEIASLSTSIVQQISVTFDAITEARQLVLGALGGEDGTNSDLPQSLLAKGVLAELGFPPERLSEMGRRIQIVRSGFVFQSGRNPDFSYWLGLRRNELWDVVRYARSLCENMRSTDRVGTLESEILGLVRAVTGSEMRHDETVGQFYSRIFSIPIDAISPLLNESPSDLIRSWHNWTSEQREEIIARVCKRARLLEYITAGKLVQERDLVVERNGVHLRPGATIKDFEWRWITPDGRTELYFIPLNALP